MAIAFDAGSESATSWTNSVSSLTFSHTCTGANRALFVVIGTYSSMNITHAAVTFNGSSLTLIQQAYTNLEAGNHQRLSLWYMVAPAAATANIVATLSGTTDFAYACGSSYTGVLQAAPIEDSETVVNGSSATASPTCTATVASSGVWLVGGGYGRGTGGFSAGAATTLRASGDAAVGTGIADSAGSVSTGEQGLAYATAVADSWRVVVAAVKEAAASGPVITGPSGTGSVLTGNGSCSTTGSTGLLWWKADASSTASDPGAGSEAGAGWTSQAVSGSGTQTVASFGALTAGTKYVHYLHVDGSSNRSTVADSSSFTVLAAAANAPRTFRPLFLNL